MWLLNFKPGDISTPRSFTESAVRILEFFSHMRKSIDRNTVYSTKQENVQSFGVEKCRIDMKSATVNCTNANLNRVPEDIPLYVEVIYLDFNYICSLNRSTFENLTNLSYLSVFDNRIRDIDPGAFHSLKRLTTLNISNNPIAYIPNDLFTPLINLQYVELRNISTGCNSFNTGSLNNMTELVHIDFSLNNEFRFPVFIKGASPLIPNLRLLNFSSNYIRELDSDIFRGLRRLSMLDLRNNMISIVKAHCLEEMVNLTYLDLSNNELTDVDGTSFWSNTLKYLILSYTSLGLNLNNKTFLNLPSLKHLSLTSSLLYRSLDSKTKFFQNLTELESFSLSDNYLRTHVVVHNIQNLTKLIYLDLGRNLIKRLRGDMFESSSKHLKFLNVPHNRITTVNITSLPMHLWTQLEQVNFVGNPMICDCGIVWFRRWIRNPNNSARA